MAARDNCSYEYFRHAQNADETEKQVCKNVTKIATESKLSKRFLAVVIGFSGFLNAALWQLRNLLRHRCGTTSFICLF
jgi:hypothetical protein